MIQLLRKRSLITDIVVDCCSKSDLKTTSMFFNSLVSYDDWQVSIYFIGTNFEGLPGTCSSSQKVMEQPRRGNLLLRKHLPYLSDSKLQQYQLQSEQALGSCLLPIKISDPSVTNTIDDYLHLLVRD